jgi:toxin ParE1/3/4
MRIIWSPLSVDRISEIAEYIAQDNPKTAEEWVNTVFDMADQLGKFPESGRIAPEINNQKIRELIYGNYRIIYRIEDDQISILTMRHGGQILPTDEIVA